MLRFVHLAALLSLLIGCRSSCSSNQVVVSGSNSDCCLRESDEVAVNHRRQLGVRWCWVASAQMMMEYLRGSSPTQCAIVEAKLNRDAAASVDCKCDTVGYTDNPDCDVSGFPDFERYHYRVRRTCYRPLQFNALRREITCFKRPFTFSWIMPGTKGTPFEEGHMLVATGYTSVEGQPWVIALDPLAPCDEDNTYLDFSGLPKDCSGDQVVLPYDKWVEQDGYYEHWHDFYALEEHRPGELIEEPCDS